MLGHPSTVNLEADCRCLSEPYWNRRAAQLSPDQMLTYKNVSSPNGCDVSHGIWVDLLRSKSLLIHCSSQCKPINNQTPEGCASITTQYCLYNPFFVLPNFIPILACSQPNLYLALPWSLALLRILISTCFSNPYSGFWNGSRWEETCRLLRNWKEDKLQHNYHDVAEPPGCTHLSWGAASVHRCSTLQRPAGRAHGPWEQRSWVVIAQQGHLPLPSLGHCDKWAKAVGEAEALKNCREEMNKTFILSFLK